MAATVQERFRALLDEHLGPWLRDEGFHRRDATFRRHRGGAWQIVAVHHGRTSGARALRITVSLGVGLAALHDDPPWAERGWPLDHECDFRTRLGHLVTGRDHRWLVRPVTSFAGAEQSVRHALETAGLPWLELHSDPQRLLAHALANPAAIDSVNIEAFVRLARRFGTPAQAGVVERERARFRAGQGPAPRGTL